MTSGKPNEGNSGTEFDSSDFAAGKTFQHQFSTTGTFDYYCTLHPFMSGKVRVTANANLQSNPSSSSSEDRRKIDLVTYNLVNKLGMPGSGEGQFNHPAAIAIDNSEKAIYVTDLDNNRIQKLDFDGEFITEWGTLGSGDGQFDEPGDIAIDSKNGVVYVTDITNNRIQKFDTEGNFLGKWGTTGTGEGQFDHPGDIAVDPTGEFIYLTDIDNNRIQKFNKNGVFVSEWGSLGSGEGQFNSPAGLTISPQGDIIYVSDTVNNRIQMFNEEGNFLGKWGILGDANGQLNRPDGITTDSTGHIVYVADRQNKRIQIFDSEGDYITVLESLGSLTGQFGKPRDIAVDFLNRMYIVDKENNNVQVFAPAQKTNPFEVNTVSSDEDNNKPVEQQISSEPNSPTRHGKSYFGEIFESDPEDPVYVVSHSTKKDKIFGDTTYDLVGEIKNKSDEEVTFVKITGTFYDDKGIVIGTDFTYTDPSDLKPGRTAPYTLSLGFGDSIDVNEIAEAKYNLEWN